MLVLTAISAFCGRPVHTFGRTIAAQHHEPPPCSWQRRPVGRACAIAGIEDAPFHQCLFEAVSAFGTVGVSMGLTPTLAAASRVILIVMMYMGRVGVLTLGVAVFMRRREPPRLKYPDADVFIG
ncbi:MAG: potassium transporter TrkG [Butyricicoccus sp.]